MNLWSWAALGLVGIGALMVAGLLAFLPQCGFGLNLFVVNACLAPITVFGLNPNLVAGVVLIGVGLTLGIFLHFEAEA